MLKKDLKGRLSIDGEDFGLYDAFTGGALDSTETKYTPADDIQRAYLSSPEIGNITLTRLYQEAVDGSTARRARALHDHAAEVVILEKDTSGQWQQNRPPYQGLVKAITPPDGDSNSAEPALIAIEISTGTPGA